MDTFYLITDRGLTEIPLTRKQGDEAWRWLCRNADAKILPRQTIGMRMRVAVLRLFLWLREKW